MDLESISSQSLCKEIAYLFGVYLTDGSIVHTSKSGGKFTIGVIDKDFAEQTLSCIKKIIPECDANIRIKKETIRFWPDGRISKCQRQYLIRAGFTKYMKFFEEQTNKKHRIPYLIWDAPLDIKRWFIAGVMDGDGWVSIKKRTGNQKSQYQVGVCKGELGWINEFYEFLQKMGINVGKKQRTLKAGKLNRSIPLIIFNINIISFVDHGLFFTMSRKQERIKQYIKTFRD